jgi:coenzyme F420-reducing hydrogenase delta subunit/Pyruvate/2-oxoacid:ferredoxin oxidoreductase delta subunit
VITLWFIGWTGYWLVWDERGHGVALSTAKALDVLPIFADPMGRSFLTDQSLNSLLFFVVFFVHMLIPLGMGIFLWLHIARLNRAKFLTRAPLTIWVVGALLVLSLFYPADSAAPARMTLIRESFTMDWWYLLPLVVSDRLGGGALWSALLIGALVAGSVPWWMARRRLGAAAITTSRCNACKQCFTDCPYGAIAMVPRTDGSTKFELQAEVSPAKCVDCGICAASCDSVGTNIDWMETIATRLRLEAWVREAIQEGEAPLLAFTCARGAGGDLAIDPKTGRCAELPGYRVLPVPCAGWVHAYTLERALRRGAREALIVACGPGQCHYREGTDWLRQRLDGERKPMLREPEAHRGRIHLLELDRTRRRDLVRMAEGLRTGDRLEAPRVPRSLAGAAAALLAVIVAGGVGAVSDLGYASPRTEGSELVVTFKHPGEVSERCHDLTAVEKAKLPVHMRRDRVCDRARADVRMRVKVDDRIVVEKAYAPKGIWHDGNSVAVETIPVAPGEHQIEVEIGDSHRAGNWRFETGRRITFTRESRRVIAFNRLDGFTVH